MGSVIAMDVGGTAVKYALVDQQGAISRQGLMETRAQEGGEALMERMLAQMERLAKGRDDLLGVAISTAGHVSRDRASVVYASNLPGWTGMPVARRVRQRTGYPCVVENDVNAAALGERWLGAARDCRALLMVTLGTGVGGAAIVGGQLLTGAEGAAGEFGHICLYPGGLPCDCGQQGCFERYASTSALKRLSGQLPQDHPGHGEVKALFAACRQGDPAAQAILDRWLEDLSQGLASLVHCYNPDVLLLGGGVSAQGEYLSGQVCLKLQRKVMPSFMAGLAVKTAALGNQAGMLGAAYSLLSRINQWMM